MEGIKGLENIKNFNLILFRNSLGENPENMKSIGEMLRGLKNLNNLELHL